MFKNRITTYEKFYKDNNGDYQPDTCLSVYEVYIETRKDKDGNLITFKDGKPKYFPVDDLSIKTLENPLKVKKISENVYKKVYEVNGEYVEKVERDNKHIYFVVEEEKLTELTGGIAVITNKEFIRIPNEKGYVLMDEKVIEKPFVVRVGKWATEDHKAEADKIAKNYHPRPKDKD